MRGVLGTRAALAATLGVLAVYHEVRRLVIPDHLHFITNAAMIGVVALPATAAAMTADELGLTRAAVPTGLRYGAVAVGAVAVVVGAAALLGIDPSNTIDDHASADLGEMLFQVFVEIPIATVLLEEFAFRGVVAGLFERVLSARAALLWSALVFGLWHVSPREFTSIGRLGGAAGTIALTAVAGAVFHMLKRRSGSLVAPMLAHWGTNGVALAVSWLAVRAI
jgi:membrane protease YdiL (CAAX protease family)